jgi:hypothetical protein
MAGTIMRSSDFRPIVEPLLNQEFDGVYNQRADEYKAIFEEKQGIARQYHEIPILYGMQAAPVKSDGAPVTYDAGGTLYTERISYAEYGIAHALTKVLFEDGDHIRIGSIYARHQAQSMKETIETVTSNILNRFNNASYLAGDGVALCSTSHVSVDGAAAGAASRSNLLTAAALSQTSLEQGLITVRQAQDPRGKPMVMAPKQLIVPPALMLTAEVLLKSVLRTGTGNNDLNPIKSTGLVARAVTLTRLSSSTAWFLQTDIDNGFQVLWRRKLEKSMEGDFETDTMRYKSTMRFGAKYGDWRCVYGNAGA